MRPHTRRKKLGSHAVTGHWRATRPSLRGGPPVGSSSLLAMGLLLGTSPASSMAAPAPPLAAKVPSKAAPTAHKSATRAYTRPTGGDFATPSSAPSKQPASTISLRGLRNGGEPTEAGSNGLPLQQNLTTALLDYLNQKSRGLYVFAPEEQLRQKRALAPYSLEGEIYAFNPASNSSAAAAGANYRCVLRLYADGRPRKLLGQWTASANSLRFLTGNLAGDRRISRDGLIGELGRRVLAQIAACSQESEAALLEDVVRQLDAGDALGIQVKLLAPTAAPPADTGPAPDPGPDPGPLDPNTPAEAPDGTPALPQPPPPGTRAWRVQIICLEDGKLYVLRKRDKNWEWLVPAPGAAEVPFPATPPDFALDSPLPDGASIRAGVPLNLTINLHTTAASEPGARRLPNETFAVFVRRSPVGVRVQSPTAPTTGAEASSGTPASGPPNTPPNNPLNNPQSNLPVRVLADSQFAIPLTPGQVWMHAFMTRLYADAPSLWLARSVVVQNGGANS